MAAENLSGNFERENESAVSRQNKAEQCQTVADIRDYKSAVQMKQWRSKRVHIFDSIDIKCVVNLIHSFTQSSPSCYSGN